MKVDSLYRSFKALGSKVILTVVAENAATANNLLTELERQIDVFEQRFSRFRSDSELTGVNQSAGRRVRISPDFFRLLSAAIKYAKISDYLYNPLILPSLQQAGYRFSWTEPGQSDTSLLYIGRRLASVSEIELTDNWVKIPNQTALDFGGIGKGYLLDELAAYAQPLTDSFWFSLGGDIIAAGLNADNQANLIGIQHATKPEEVVDHFEIGSDITAIATSGITKRQGPGWHHLIDPRTGQPAVTDLLTVSAVFDQATAADVLAKCAVIAGSDKAWPYLKQRGASAAVLQRANGDQVEIIKH